MQYSKKRKAYVCESTMDSAGETFKATISKALVTKINIAIVIFLLVTCVAVVGLQPVSMFNTDVASLVECVLRDCHSKKVRLVKVL